MSSGKIRLALLGCGRIADFHMEGLKENKDTYEIVGVCDVSAERAREAAGRWGTQAHDSFESLLAAGSVDLAVLTTPSGLHPRQARLCADAGVACLSEKTFGVHYSEAQEVVEHFEKKKVPLFVVMQNRYHPTVQKVRKWLTEGRLGKLYMVQSNVLWQRPQSYYDASPWRGTRELDGGAFMNQASHYVDLLQWFGGGEVDSVKSELATFERKIECEDTGAALIRFKSGAIGTMSVTMVAYPENIEGSLTLLAENATIRLNGKSLGTLEICRGKDPEVAAGFTPPEQWNGYGDYYRRLISYLRDPFHPDAITGREALKSLKIITEMYRTETYRK